LIKKVVAYITRLRKGRPELLVFTHRDSPDAGVQVPAGTVKPGESIEAALVSEVSEETGLEGLVVVGRLGVYDYAAPGGPTVERHVYHVQAPKAVQGWWEWLETGGGEMPDEEGYVFQFYWLDLADDVELAGNQGDYLGVLRAGMGM
jgi:8-oxo-dGTP pyrophosphatase MutT (NUDIX family)